MLGSSHMLSIYGVLGEAFWYCFDTNVVLLFLTLGLKLSRTKDVANLSKTKDSTMQR